VPAGERRSEPQEPRLPGVLDEPDEQRPLHTLREHDRAR
jgi:hypothetical protein